MSRFLRIAALGLVAVVLMGAAAQAASRVALVIGNAAYTRVPRLVTPTNDAQDVAAALKGLGFEVMVQTDLDRDGMNEALQRFSHLARGAEIVFVYYSGHGMQFAGRNYLLPTDVRLESEADINRFAMLPLDDLMEVVERSHGARILVLDACRNNPIEDQLKRRIAALSGRSRSAPLSRGLGRESALDGMLIAYATQSNATAADGTGRNSPFTKAFLRHVATPGLDVRQMFFRVQDDVDRETRGQQRPELSISLVGKFSMNPQPGDRPDTAQTAPAEPADPAKLASLPPPQETAPEANSAPPDAENLSRALQRELKRTGCYDGEIDGRWGARSRAALKDFNHHSGRRRGGAADLTEVTAESLAAVAASEGRVCPIECGRGTVLVDGRCIARSEQKKKKERVVERHPPRSAPADAVPNPANMPGFGRRPLGPGAGALRARCRGNDLSACRALCALGGARACRKATFILNGFRRGGGGGR